MVLPPNLALMLVALTVMPPLDAVLGRGMGLHRLQQHHALFSMLMQVMGQLLQNAQQATNTIPILLLLAM